MDPEDEDDSDVEAAFLATMENLQNRFNDHEFDPYPDRLRRLLVMGKFIENYYEVTAGLIN